MGHRRVQRQNAYQISFAGHIQVPCVLQGPSRQPERSTYRQSAAVTGRQKAGKHDLRQSELTPGGRASASGSDTPRCS